MRVAVVTFPGSNCDYDCYKAVKATLGEDAFYVWHRNTDLENADAVILPGGFSYGDYLRAGSIARFSPVMGSVRAYAEAGGAVLGICNGFQILCEAGMLPGALVRNDSLQFRSRAVHIKVEQIDSVYTRRYAEGQVTQRDAAKAQIEVSLTLEQLYLLEEKRALVVGALNMLMDRNPLSDLGEVAQPEKPEIVQTLVELITAARENRPEVKKADAQVKGEQHTRRLAWMENLPDVSAGFTYTWVGNGFTTNADDGKDSWMFPLAISVPLWQNRIISAARDGADVISLSLGAASPTVPKTMRDAVAFARASCTR